jgi:hypothetical protein
VIDSGTPRDVTVAPRVAVLVLTFVKVGVERLGATLVKQAFELETQLVPLGQLTATVLGPLQLLLSFDSIITPFTSEAELLSAHVLRSGWTIKND